MSFERCDYRLGELLVYNKSDCNSISVEYRWVITVRAREGATAGAFGCAIFLRFGASLDTVLVHFKTRNKTNC